MARYFTRANTEYLFRSASAPITDAPFTASAWANTAADTTADDFCIFQLQDASGAQDYWRLNAGPAGQAGEFAFVVRDTGNSAQQAVSTIVPTIGVWYNVIGVARSSTDRECFVNGGNSGVNVVNRSPNNVDSVAIGREMDSSPDDPWDGPLAEIGVWDVGLSDLEVFLLAQGRPPPTIRPQSLVAYWPLYGVSDRDFWNARFNMTAFNTPTWISHPPKVLAWYAKYQNRAIVTQTVQPTIGENLIKGWSLQARIRMPRYGFTNFQVPGIV